MDLSGKEIELDYLVALRIMFAYITPMKLERIIWDSKMSEGNKYNS
jgi:hypothetical protein